MIHVPSVIRSPEATVCFNFSINHLSIVNGSFSVIFSQKIIFSFDKFKGDVVASSDTIYEFNEM